MKLRLLQSSSSSAAVIGALALLTSLGLLAGAPASQSWAAGQARSEGAAGAASSGTSSEKERLASELIDSLGSTNPTSGSTDSGPLTKVIASALVRGLDPQNSRWNPMHPQWPEMSRMIEEDIASDLQIELTQRRSGYQSGLISDLAERLSEDEFKQLLQYLSSPEGQRYRNFQAELLESQAMAMRALMSGSTAPAGSAPVAHSERPSEETMTERLKLIDRSTTAQVTRVWLDEAQRTHGDVSGYQAWAMMAGVIAMSEGPKLDDIEARYATDLKSIDNFNSSALGQRLYAALGAAGKDSAQHTVAENQSFQDAEAAKYGAKWKSKYADITGAH